MPSFILGAGKSCQQVTVRGPNGETWKLSADRAAEMLLKGWPAACRECGAKWEDPPPVRVEPGAPHYLIGHDPPSPPPKVACG